MNRQKNELFSELDSKQIIAFALITCCFALWGFTMDMTSAIASAFSKIFRLSVTEGSLVNVANHLGYLVMAIPAALFIQKYKFKAGVLMGLCIYAAGALLFLPSRFIGTFTPFLFAYFVMTCGSAFLETCCHPMIYCMGSEHSGTRRINLAQAFNSLGALAGMFVVRDVVLADMSPLSKAERLLLPETQFDVVKYHDLTVLIQPYIYICSFIILLMVVIRLQKIKMSNDSDSQKGLMQEVRHLINIKNYREGVVAQFFYVGAQVCCWAFTIQYGVRIFIAEGMTEAQAELLAQKYNIAAIVLFAAFRFICTWLLKYVAAGRLLAVMAIAATAFTLGVILFTDRNGLYCLIADSACMSLMFATIYGIALRGMGKDVKMASAGMTMAVFGGAVFTALQASIIDTNVTLLGLPATNLSFLVPMVGFAVVAFYGHRSYVRHNIVHDYNA